MNQEKSAIFEHGVIHPYLFLKMEIWMTNPQTMHHPKNEFHLVPSFTQATYAREPRSSEKKVLAGNDCIAENRTGCSVVEITDAGRFKVDNADEFLRNCQDGKRKHYEEP